VNDHFIEFEKISIGFGDQPVLKEVSFFVDQGETLVIMGRSGVGKSVALKILMGFLKPDSGRVIVSGQDVTQWTEKQFQELHKRVTMVFQSGALFDSLTAAENVAFPLVGKPDWDDGKIQARVKELLDMLEVEGLADTLPGELPTGTKRAVAIARGLAMEPEAIFYDEPTTMVDPIMSAHVAELILKLKKTLKKTSIVVTHDTHLGEKLADRIVFLHEGRAEFFGPWKDFAASGDPLLKHFLAEDRLIPALDMVIGDPIDVSAQARDAKAQVSARNV
jgi:phospholipid/cholesterol/gamma-HCH transport system ATP-binding protein